MPGLLRNSPNLHLHFCSCSPRVHCQVKNWRNPIKIEFRSHLFLLKLSKISHLSINANIFVRASRALPAKAPVSFLIPTTECLQLLIFVSLVVSHLRLSSWLCMNSLEESKENSLLVSVLLLRHRAFDQLY